jgi:hypothetical protein
MRLSLILRLLLAFSSFAWLASAEEEMPHFRIGLLTNTGAEVAAAKASVMPDIGVEVVDLRTGEMTLLRNFPLAIVTATCDEGSIKAFEDYVVSGGTVAFLGHAALSERIRKLCGLEVATTGGCSSLRLWGYTPLFIGIRDYSCQQLPERTFPAVLAFPDTKAEMPAIFASAEFSPDFSVDRNGCRIYSWYNATRCYDEGIYLSVLARGQGAAIFVAENLLCNGARDQRTRFILTNLLSPLALTLKGTSSPAPPLFANTDGNLLLNGNMQADCLVSNSHSKDKVSPSPHKVAMGWTHNFWNGQFRVMLVEEKSGNRYMQTTFCGSESEALGACCVFRQHRRLVQLNTKVPYTLRFSIRADCCVRASLRGQLSDGTHWEYSIMDADPSLGKSTDDAWVIRECTFQLPATCFNGQEPQPGFFLDFSMQDGRRCALDDVSLKQLTKGTFP